MNGLTGPLTKTFSFQYNWSEHFEVKIWGKYFEVKIWGKHLEVIVWGEHLEGEGIGWLVNWNQLGCIQTFTAVTGSLEIVETVPKEITYSSKYI